MTRRLFIFDPPERFVAGAIGEPGGRTFYLQARKGGALVSVVLEKAQVAVMASRLSELLDVVVPGAGTVTPVEPDDRPLEQPLVDQFRVGLMALAWDPGRERVVIEAQPQGADGDEPEAEVADEATDGPDLMRVHITPGDAREFVRRAGSLIAAGRPPCPFCGQPLEPTGHFCTRTNSQLN